MHSAAALVGHFLVQALQQLGKLSVVQYLGLFLEAEGSKDESAAAIKTALQTPYARTGDYMVAVALVHAKSRGISAGES